MADSREGEDQRTEAEQRVIDLQEGKIINDAQVKYSDGKPYLRIDFYDADRVKQLEQALATSEQPIVWEQFSTEENTLWVEFDNDHDNSMIKLVCAALGLPEDQQDSIANELQTQKQAQAKPPLKKMEEEERPRTRIGCDYPQTEPEKTLIAELNRHNADNFITNDINLRKLDDGSYHVQLEFGGYTGLAEFEKIMKLSEKEISFQKIDKNRISVPEENAAKVMEMLGVAAETIEAFIAAGKEQIRLKTGESILEMGPAISPPANGVAPARPAAAEPANPAAVKEPAAEPPAQPIKSTRAQLERGSHFLDTKHIAGTEAKIKEKLQGWDTERQPSAGRLDKIEVHKHDNPGKSFEIHPSDKLKTTNTDRETFVAMLQAFKALDPDKLPVIKTATEALKQEWVEAMNTVYPDIKNPQIELRGETLKAAPKAEAAVASAATESKEPEAAAARPGLGSGSRE